MQSIAKKSAFLFPGQGVLAPDVIDYYTFLKNKDASQTEKFILLLQNALDEINPQAKFNALEGLANPTAAVWSQTSFVQPLTYALSVLTYELLRNEKKDYYTPIFMLGHSLGAFSALTAAGAMPFEQGTRVVVARGKFMQEESAKTNHGMCAIIGLTEDKVQAICDKTNSAIALINAPTAFVIGCERDAFPQIELEAAQLGARKTIRLETSGAFHTKIMQGAYAKFKEFFATFPLQIPHVPVITNIAGTSSTDPVDLKNDCLESIINPINWARMMEFLKNNQVTSYIEAGPGTSLSSLSKINGIEREQILHARSILE